MTFALARGCALWAASLVGALWACRSSQDEQRQPKDPAERVVAMSRALDLELGSAAFTALRVRRLVSEMTDWRRDTWQQIVDQRIRYTVAAWCGNPFPRPERTVDVFATPVEDMFPVDVLEDATAAYCGGLIVDGRAIPGPAWAGRDAPADAGTAR